MIDHEIFAAQNGSLQKQRPVRKRSAQRCARDDTVVAATGNARGKTSYPAAATSGIVKHSPGFIQAMPTKMKTGIAGGRRRAKIAAGVGNFKTEIKRGKHHEHHETS